MVKFVDVVDWVHKANKGIPPYEMPKLVKKSWSEGLLTPSVYSAPSDALSWSERAADYLKEISFKSSQAH